MSEIKGFFLFLKQPNAAVQIEILSLKSFLKLVWKSLLFLIAFDVIIGLVISTPLKYFDLFPMQREIVYDFKSIIKISLLLPIIEELIFRLPLRISRTNLAISLSLILFVFLNRLNIILSISLSLLLFLFLFLPIKKEAGIFDRIKFLSYRYFLLFFYIQAIIFGFLHLTNYKLDIHYFYLFPFFVLSYIVAGCFLGYLRVKYNYGIYLCITSHIVMNSLYCLILSK
jgi:hypothetical protein